MDAFIGEIRLMSFPFAPKGWAYCQGQTLAINTNQALFSLLGTMYGGDGVTTFRLPDLRGRVITGVVPGTSPQGQLGGVEAVTLTQAQMPMHTHNYQGTIKTATTAEYPEASQTFPAKGTTTQFATGTPNASLGSGALPNTTTSFGGSQAHDNRQPLIAMNYAIALTGYFPSRG